jgi:hypothetical protein
MSHRGPRFERRLRSLPVCQVTGRIDGVDDAGVRSPAVQKAVGGLFCVVAVLGDQGAGVWWRGRAQLLFSGGPNQQIG